MKNLVFGLTFGSIIVISTIVVIEQVFLYDRKKTFKLKVVG